AEDARQADLDSSSSGSNGSSSGGGGGGGGVNCKDKTQPARNQHPARTPPADCAGGSDNGGEECSSTFKYQRRRSRAVLYHLSGQFDSRNKSKPFSQLNKIHSLGGGSAMPEYKVQEVKKSRCILLHYGLLKISWDWLILLFTFYIAIMVPYNAANSNGRARKAGTAAIEDAGVVIDLLVEVVFIAGKLKLCGEQAECTCDICINFRTTFVSKGGQVVYCQRLIAINYTKTWFFLDLLAAVPFDMIIIISKARSNVTEIQCHSQRSNVSHKIYSEKPQCTIATNSAQPVQEAFNLMKLARMLRLVKLYQKIDRYAQYSSLVLLLLISMFALSAHWFACIWLVIGRKQLELNQTREISWMSKLSDDMKAPFNFQCSVDEDRPGNASGGCSEGGPTKSSRYITALYYTCSSLTSIGFGNVSANTDHEKIFSICIMLIGALMHAAVFGNVTALIQKMYARRAAYTAKTQELKDFTRTHHIPKHLKRRMQEFFQAMWSINRGINPNEVSWESAFEAGLLKHGVKMGEIMKDFPDELRGDIALHLNREILSLPIFESASQGCLKAIAQQILTVFCRPEEYIVHSGDVLKYIYYVVNGSMEILKDNMVVAIL
uniref:Cyclic nucleotide-binding domain-containing protein n=3 Tax=Macrostomum lignano TaxID=282301 RepID=A0A1I8IR17_9PLAT